MLRPSKSPLFQISSAPIWEEQGAGGVSLAPGVVFGQRGQSSLAAAAFGTGRAPVLSPNTSHQRVTLFASGLPKVLWVLPQVHPHVNYHPTIASLP